MSVRVLVGLSLAVSLAAQAPPPERPAARAALDGLQWLARHQQPDGAWAMPEGAPPGTDVRIVALATLAFLGNGSTMRTGPHRDPLKNAARWLHQIQNETGRFGTGPLWNHALATWAMTETWILSNYKLLERDAKEGIAWLIAQRNVSGAWGAFAEGVPDGFSTAWALMALVSAHQRLTIDDRVIADAAAWLAANTTATTGRLGFRRRGEFLPRPDAESAKHFPPERVELMTALGLGARLPLPLVPGTRPVLDRGAETLRRSLPVWDETGGCIDTLYWFVGTRAVEEHWGPFIHLWSEALVATTVPRQRTEGDVAGSWDPVGAWGARCGRAHTTALLVLALQAAERARLR